MIYLHNMDLYHRDLRCANILLTKDYDVKISDFGIALFSENENQNVDVQYQVSSSHRTINIDDHVQGNSLYIIDNNQATANKQMTPQELAKYALQLDIR